MGVTEPLFGVVWTATDCPKPHGVIEDFSPGHNGEGRRVWRCSVCKREGVWTRSWVAWAFPECAKCWADGLQYVCCSDACMDKLQDALKAPRTPAKPGALVVASKRQGRPLGRLHAARGTVDADCPECEATAGEACVDLRGRRAKRQVVANQEGGCPKCAAPPGEPCVDMRTRFRRPLAYLHPERHQRG